MGKIWQWNDVRYCSKSAHFESCQFSEDSLILNQNFIFRLHIRRQCSSQKHSARHNKEFFLVLRGLVCLATCFGQLDRPWLMHTAYEIFDSKLSIQMTDTNCRIKVTHGPYVALGNEGNHCKLDMQIEWSCKMLWLLYKPHGNIIVRSEVLFVVQPSR